MDDCITDGTAGDHAFLCGGLTFDVRVPEACLGEACGLIVDVHGLTMDAGMEDANTDLKALGEAHGYIVIQPNSPGTPPYSSWSEADDDTVYDFLLRAASAWHVDPDRVHFTGFSQGAQMTWRFLCDHAEVFGSVAPASAGWSTNGCSFDDLTGKPSVEVPVLYVHGVLDAVVNYSGALTQVALVTSAWNLTDTTVLADDGHYARTRYANDHGGLLEFIHHDYQAKSSALGGHCVAGSDDLDGLAPGQLFGFGCNATCGFDWGEEVMAFFIAHPRHTGG